MKKFYLIFGIILYSMFNLIWAETIRLDSQDRNADFEHLTNALDVAMPGDTLLVFNGEDYKTAREHAPSNIIVILSHSANRGPGKNSSDNDAPLSGLRNYDIFTATLSASYSGTRGSNPENPCQIPCPDTWTGSEIGGGYFSSPTAGPSIYRGIIQFDLSGIPLGSTIISAFLRFWSTSVTANTTLNFYENVSATSGVNPQDFAQSGLLAGQQSFSTEQHPDVPNGPHQVTINPNAITPGVTNKFITRSQDDVLYCSDGNPMNSYSYVYIPNNNSAYYTQLIINYTPPASSGINIDPNPLLVNEPYNSGIFTITNTGDNPVTLSFSSTDTWIQNISPVSTTLQAGQSANVTVSTDPQRKNYTPGTYEGTVWINGASQTTYVNILWQVSSHPEFTPFYHQVNLSDPDNLDQWFTMTNTGNVPLEILNLTTDPSNSWLDFSGTPITGPVSPDYQTQLNINADPTGLPGGTHQGTATVNYQEASNPNGLIKNFANALQAQQTTSIQVSLSIPLRWDIEVTPTSTDLSADRTAAVLTVFNHSNTGMNWDAEIETGLTLNKISGILSMNSQDNTILTYDAKNLLPGNHVKRIIFRARANNQTVDSVIVTVNLTVSPYLKIIAPNGGEILAAGATCPLIYEANSANLIYRYSLDNGTNWQAIQSRNKLLQALSLDTISWLTPSGVNSDNCFIKIAMLPDTLVYFDTSNAPFAIHEIKTLTVLEPNGGEWLFRNQPSTISWAYTGLMDSVNIYLCNSNDSNAMCTPITLAWPADNSEYSWNAPDIAYEQAYIKITETGNEENVFDYSDSAFTIGDTLLFEFVEPGDSSDWLAGQMHRIRWQSQGPTSDLVLRVSLDKGLSYILIDDSLKDTGYYDWTTPLVVRDTVYLTLASIQYPDKIFRSPPFSLVYPASFTQYPVISSQTDQSCRIDWQTDLPISCQIALRTLQNPSSWDILPAGGNTLQHYSELNGLALHAEYEYRIHFYLNSTPIDSSTAFTFTTLSKEPLDSNRLYEKPQILYIGQNQAIISFFSPYNLHGAIRLNTLNPADSITLKEDSAHTSHLFTITNLIANRLYQFRIGYWQQADNSYHFETVRYEFRTLSNADTLPPIVVWGPYATVSDNRAEILFGVDEACQATLSLTPTPQTMNTEYLQHTAFQKIHSFILTQLHSGTRYQFELEFSDPAGNSGSWKGEASLLAKAGLQPPGGGNNSFTTNTQSDTLPPAFTQVPLPLTVYDSLVIINWKTDEAARYRIELFNTSNELLKVIDKDEYRAQQTLVIGGLEPLQSYRIFTSVSDLSGNEQRPELPLQIRTRKSGSIVNATITSAVTSFHTAQYAVFSWQTDIGCDSRSLTESRYPFNTPFIFANYDLIRDHILVMNNLPEDVTLFYQLQSADYFSNLVYQGSIDSLSAAAGEPSALQFASLPVITYRNNQLIRIAWETNELSSSFAEYQADHNGTWEDPIIISDQKLTRDHDLLLNQLASGTNYRIHIYSLTTEEAIIETTLFTQTFTEPDLTPPAPPTGISAGYVDSLSAILIQWLNNSETDFSHYSIWRIQPDVPETTLYFNQYLNNWLIDEDVEPHQTYQYLLKSIDLSGNISSEAASNIIVSVEASSNLPFSNPLYLSQNYPNPFNPTTLIEMSSKIGGTMIFCIYDLLGNQILREEFELQPNTILKKVLDMNGYPAGIFLYSLRDRQGHSIIRKMALLK